MNSPAILRAGHVAFRATDSEETEHQTGVCDVAPGIIELAGEGMSAREIAFYLSLDARLVKKCLHTIFGPARPERRLPVRTT